MFAIFSSPPAKTVPGNQARRAGDFRPRLSQSERRRKMPPPAKTVHRQRQDCRGARRRRGSQLDQGQSRTKYFHRQHASIPRHAVIRCAEIFPPAERLPPSGDAHTGADLRSKNVACRLLQWNRLKSECLPPAKMFPPAVTLPTESLPFLSRSETKQTCSGRDVAACRDGTSGLASIPLAAVILPPAWIFPAQMPPALMLWPQLVRSVRTPIAPRADDRADRR